MGRGDSFNVASNSGQFDVPLDLRWPDSPGHIPDWVYTDPRIYEIEQKRIFQGRTWNFVGLEAEVAKPGDFIRSYVGSIPVIVTRDEAGDIHVFENRCAHRGLEFCRSHRGTTKQFVCPYHQWTYDLSGRLTAVPFRRGLKGQGGMSADFRLEDNNLLRLKVARRGGTVFASFCRDMEPLDEYLGADITAEFDTLFNGRELRLLGTHRNIIPSNWKLYQENLKDPYHATLLHTYLTTFGLFVAGNKSAIVTDRIGRHCVLMSKRPDSRPKADEYKVEIGSFHETMPLYDPRVLEFVEEFASTWSSCTMTIWPNLVVLRQSNILGTRQIVPRGPHEFLLVWTMFGFADDTEEMTRHRLRQCNIFGPGGFLGIDDNEALKFVQDGIRHSVSGEGLALLGRDDEPVDTVITDRAIRSMYRHYRQAIEL